MFSPWIRLRYTCYWEMSQEFLIVNFHYINIINKHFKTGDLYAKGIFGPEWTMGI